MGNELFLATWLSNAAAVKNLQHEQAKTMPIQKNTAVHCFVTQNSIVLVKGSMIKRLGVGETLGSVNA